MQKYVIISNDIRNKILNGEYVANQQIPFEKDLCVHYNASKMTVKSLGYVGVGRVDHQKARFRYIRQGSECGCHQPHQFGEPIPRNDCSVPR